jgi:adenosylcobinamide kinase/adenosylcobinamide-phosphate guanylyltransferase
MSSPSADPPRVALVGGGVRSGKSAFALARARALGERRVFVATGQALDGEMAERIAAHVHARGADFRTVEEPLDLPNALRALGDRGADVVVVDCLTLWLSNLLMRGDGEAQVAAHVDELVTVLARRRFHALVVTNEVGLGIVPESALARLFRDVAGRAHQRLAGAADEIYLAILGTILRLRPAPLAVMPSPTPPTVPETAP